MTTQTQQPITIIRVTYDNTQQPITIRRVTYDYTQQPIKIVRVTYDNTQQPITTNQEQWLLRTILFLSSYL